MNMYPYDSAMAHGAGSVDTTQDISRVTYSLAMLIS